MTQFFSHYMIVTFFFYGLAFFSMGLAIWLELRRTSELEIAKALGYLAEFGILHGSHEWIEMFQKTHVLGHLNPEISTWFGWGRILLLAISFLALGAFGAHLVFPKRQNPKSHKQMIWGVVIGLCVLWLICVRIALAVYQPDTATATVVVDALTRYLLGIPGALLATWGLFLEGKAFIRNGMHEFGNYLRRAAIAFFIYGVIGQIFINKSPLFPSSLVNSQFFLELFGVPVQLLRALMAAIIAFFMIRALQVFEFENQRRLAEINAARLQEVKNREKLRGELLKKLVYVQDEERRRIARELHDGIGQKLTAMSLVIAAIGERSRSVAHEFRGQLDELKHIGQEIMDELHHMVSDLRPSVLDDLGLIPALRGHLAKFQERTGVNAKLKIDQQQQRLSPYLETEVFRIVQEAMTNTVRHAKAKNIIVTIYIDHNEVKASIEDDGQGFDTQKVLDPSSNRRLGLLGMQERALLIKGKLSIRSAPGEGTTIDLRIPLNPM